MKNTIEFLKRVVYYANNVGYDYDTSVEVIEEGPDFVKVKTSDIEDGEDYLTATIRVLGDFEFVNTDYDGHDENAKVTLLGIWIDGENDPQRWRVIDARGSSLFAVLYC